MQVFFNGILYKQITTLIITFLKKKKTREVKEITWY